MNYYEILPLYWQVLTNDGTNVTARNIKTGSTFNGLLADFNASFVGITLPDLPPVYMQPAAPVTAIEGAVWYDTTNSAWYSWNGSAWEALGEGGGGGAGEDEKRVDYIATDTFYVGVAANGTLESAEEWTINRIIFDSTGTITDNQQLSNISWTNRASAAWT